MAASAPSFRIVPSGKDFEVEACSQHVLAEVAGAENAALRAQRLEELGGDEMDLSCVRHRRVVPHQVAMTDDRSGMSITFDPDALEENQAFVSRLAEAMLVVAGETDDP